MKKRFAALCLIVCLLILMTACGKENESAKFYLYYLNMNYTGIVSVEYDMQAEDAEGQVHEAIRMLSSETGSVDYMKTIPVEKLQEKEIWDFVGAYVKDPYSPQFDYVIFNIDRLANKVKFDRYSVERQLGWALERAVDQVVEVKFDKDGVPLRLVDAAGKVDTLLRLIDRGNLKRAETLRAKIRIYELELAQKWNEIYECQMMYRGIKALGFSDRYLEETAQYLAAYCPDKAVIEKYLTLIEKLQQEEDKGSSKLRSYYYGTLSVLHAKLGNAAKAKEFKKMDEKIKAEKAKEFESFLKKSN